MKFQRQIHTQKLKDLVYHHRLLSPQYTAINPLHIPAANSKHNYIIVFFLKKYDPHKSAQQIHWCYPIMLVDNFDFLQFTNYTSETTSRSKIH